MALPRAFGCRREARYLIACLHSRLANAKRVSDEANIYPNTGRAAMKERREIEHLLTRLNASKRHEFPPKGQRLVAPGTHGVYIIRACRRRRRNANGWPKP